MYSLTHQEQCDVKTVENHPVSLANHRVEPSYIRHTGLRQISRMFFFFFFFFFSEIENPPKYKPAKRTIYENRQNLLPPNLSVLQYI